MTTIALAQGVYHEAFVRVCDGVAALSLISRGFRVPIAPICCVNLRVSDRIFLFNCHNKFVGVPDVRCVKLVAIALSFVRAVTVFLTGCSSIAGLEWGLEWELAIAGLGRGDLGVVLAVVMVLGDLGLGIWYVG